MPFNLQGNSVDRCSIRNIARLAWQTTFAAVFWAAICPLSLQAQTQPGVESGLSAEPAAAGESPPKFEESSRRNDSAQHASSDNSGTAVPEFESADTSDPPLPKEPPPATDNGAAPKDAADTGDWPTQEFASITEPSSGTLPYYLQLALDNHPALDEAAASIAAMQQDAVQAGLCPNPQLGLFADEVGNEDSAGLVGAYLQRKIIRGNKRGLARQAKCLESEVLTQQFLQQVQRIETDVRTEFYLLLVAQRRVELTDQLRRIQQQAVETATRLNEAKESPLTDVLQTEVQAGLTEIKWQQAKIRQQAAWRRLMTAISFPELQLQTIAGSLNDLTEDLVFEQVLVSILDRTPERQAAVAAIDRALGHLNLEMANAIPDYQTQVRVGQDTLTDDFFAGFQLQVPLQINDRNQGAIAAARQRVIEARQRLAKVELRISRRLANEFESYESANIQVRVYDSRLLPKSRETLELVSEGYQEGEVGFLQVLAAQQSLLDLTLEYLGSLETLWTSRQRIEGLTLTNSLAF